MEGITVPIVLLTVGTLAFFLEAFIPSGGLISVVAAICVIASIVLAFANVSALAGVVFLCAAMVLVPTALVLAFRFFRKSRIGKRFTLQSTEAGYVAQDMRETELVGQTGVAVSMLRPSGEARIGGRKYDVVTEGEIVSKGAAIEVRHVEGNRIVVREVRERKQFATDKHG